MTKSGPPRIVPAGDVPPEVRKAALELVAQILREQTTVYTLNLNGLTYEGQPIGDYEISIRRTDV